MEPAVAKQPALDVGRLVGGIVVEDEVDFELGRDFFIDLDQELLELFGPAALLERTDDLSRCHVERGEEAGGAVTYVVVGSALGGGGHHGKDRLEPVERLDLGFLVHAQDGRALWRVQVEPDDVTNLFDKERAGGQFEGLQFDVARPERPPDPPDRRRAQYPCSRPSNASTGVWRLSASPPTSSRSRFRPGHQRSFSGLPAVGHH